jgi:SAM-dependent MidA family methyltransferase
MGYPARPGAATRAGNSSLIMATPASLPDPDPAALERSARLSERIRAAIRAAGGMLAFDRYMQMALYEPGLGYYVADTPIFGRAGDFVTAPEAGELFAACLARQCRDILAATGGGIVEYGAGSGRLAGDLLAALAALGVEPRHYWIVEPSLALARRQRAHLAARTTPRAGEVRWFEDHPTAAHRGVVIVNEVLDAMPARRFVVLQGQVHELGVGLDGEAFTWMADDAPLPRPWPLADAKLAALPERYVSEWHAGLATWLRAVRERLEQGLVLIADYGYPRHEYLHPARASGTLKCHYRQRAHGDPFFHPGLQDITVAIDFTALAEAAADAGFTVAGYATQAAFLLGCGLTEILAAGAGDPVRDFTRAQEAKLLLLPGEMGETFKFMGLAAAYGEGLRGFARDERHRLAGMDGRAP